MLVDVMKILGELYLQQRGIEGTVRTIPIKKKQEEITSQAEAEAKEVKQLVGSGGS